MEDLKRRLRAVARVEEGGTPPESPVDLLRDLNREVLVFESLVSRIDRTNAAATIADGSPLTSALIRRDMMRYRHMLLTSLCDHAITSSTPRYSARELRMVPAVDVSQLRRDAATYARDGRLLDAAIQRTNWVTSLVDP